MHTRARAGPHVARSLNVALARSWPATGTVGLNRERLSVDAKVSRWAIHAVSPRILARSGPCSDASVQR